VGGWLVLAGQPQHKDNIDQTLLLLLLLLATPLLLVSPGV
jgi:hypothetical protein